MLRKVMLIWEQQFLPTLFPSLPCLEGLLGMECSTAEQNQLLVRIFIARDHRSENIFRDHTGISGPGTLTSENASLNL